ncbi:hypothetical protein JAAARDRAFT_60703 [Jaapia argillacea MUCL 33604]|uniref:Uncharacterized protein n=1 Tax=Jaapia argillacea MUCL 33604 TaxID=933084 RepID=A0A067PHL0_9AGAM|nr:hypothetical protein JAAARDRAFT_60703 [Jaapia argillacea MUCL 33604]
MNAPSVWAVVTAHDTSSTKECHNSRKDLSSPSSLLGITLIDRSNPNLQSAYIHISYHLPISALWFFVFALIVVRNKLYDQVFL